jgi:hypothetical protein
MSESDNPDPFEIEQPELRPVDTEIGVAEEDLRDLSEETLDHLERTASALANYERAVAERERAATERANAVAAQENARAKRVFLERIGDRYLPYAGFLVFGFLPLVFGVTQVLQYTDIRLWVGSGLLALGIGVALGLLGLADGERIARLLNR